MKIRRMVQGRWKIFADQQLALIQPGGQNLPIKLQLEPFLIYRTYVTVYDQNPCDFL